MTMPKRIDVKVTKPQNTHGQGRARKCSIDLKCRFIKRLNAFMDIYSELMSHRYITEILSISRKIRNKQSIYLSFHLVRKVCLPEQAQNEGDDPSKCACLIAGGGHDLCLTGRAFGAHGVLPELLSRDHNPWLGDHGYA